MTTGQNDFYYSNKYEDDEYEYRHVHVTKEVAKLIPKNRLMSETEWRSLGIQQSPGWVHYMIHGPERHVLLFRRPLPNKNNVAGKNATQAQTKGSAAALHWPDRLQKKKAPRRMRTLPYSELCAVRTTDLRPRSASPLVQLICSLRHTAHEVDEGRV
ncbi:Cyclin-dependent kinase regulatory subunit [Teladorsagia circumcincta]|uniref:Cyclin-dependent kinases regulatory subunit n=1 Tax=Teladorsagia circumcincta TaxID=45464 RepID=A0A2G9UKR7_TELCI|nr:Cyclin-dependent kinase regulatory subunit [Teladorsagia circumcincta]